MEVFVEVARLRSLAAAARSLGISRAAVSKQIQALETKLDARLLHRSTREVSLTDAGQAFLDPCIATIEQAREAARAVTPQGDELAGPLRIQAPSSFGSVWLADALARFSLQHPRLVPTLHVDDALLDPIRHGFDLTIRVGGIPDTHGLSLRRLAPCRGVLCASPGYIEKWGMPAAPEDLARHRCLHFSHLPDGAHWHLSRGKERRTVKANVVLAANNGLVLHQAALRGVGVVYSTTFLAWRALLDGALVPVLPEWALPLNDLSALYPASRRPSPKVRALIDFLVAEYQPVPPWDRPLLSLLQLNPGSDPKRQNRGQTPRDFNRPG